MPSSSWDRVSEWSLLATSYSGWSLLEINCGVGGMYLLPSKRSGSCSLPSMYPCSSRLHGASLGADMVIMYRQAIGSHSPTGVLSYRLADKSFLLHAH